MSASLILAFVSLTAKMPNATIATAIVTLRIAAKYERTCFILFPSGSGMIDFHFATLAFFLHNLDQINCDQLF